MEQGRRMGGSSGEPTQPRPRVRRSKKKKKTIFSNPAVYLLFVFGVSAILAAFGWTAANDVLALNKPERSAVITVTEGDNYGNVVKRLKDEGIISSKALFRLISFVAGASKKMTAGTYELNTDMDYFAIINGIGANSNIRMTTVVTIPEGYTVDQTFKLLEEKGVSTQAKLKEKAGTHDYNFSFLKDIPLGDYHRLEGYLFPDTYEFYMGEDARYVLNKMLVNFDAKVGDEVRNAIYNQGYSIHQMLTIASMIEKETDGTDRSLISSVIQNRLKKPNNETVGYLQIDATIQYVLPEGETVTRAHYNSVDSVYNTYKYKGLPPGPIANPGMESIVAAMNPEQTSYYFYVLGEDGKHIFSKTEAEHNAVQVGLQS